MKKLMQSLRRCVPNRLKPYLRPILRLPEPTGLTASERRRLRRFPRFSETDVVLFDMPVRIVDSASFLFMHDEIFRKRVYDFSAASAAPYVIDAGANIGLGTIFMKRRFPDAVIDAFEPDARVFNALAHNVESFGFRGVKLHRQAVWDADGTVRFHPDGADGGRIDEQGSGDAMVEIPTVRLREILEGRRVDFLKMDIEGSETRVLRDCAGALRNVENLFVEYHSYADREQTLDELLACLRGAGFRYHIHQTGVHSPFPFRKQIVEAGMDLQLNVFACRVCDLKGAIDR